MRPAALHAVGRGGYSIVELVAVLALLTLGVAVSTPSVRRFADEAHVRAARERLAGGLLRGRAMAVASGGSTVTVVVNPPTLRVTVSDSVVHEVALGDGRTRVVLTRGRDSLALRFDALGIGRFTSASVALRRGDADASVVLSSYGRVRRR